MSLLRTVALRAPRAPRLLAATSTSTTSRFSTSPYAKKDSGSAVKDTIDSVNKTVGDAAVKGIEKGQQASEAIKSTVGLNANKAEGTAQKMGGEASGKASELMGEAKGKGQEVMGEAKGKGQEVAGQAKGKAEEIKGKM